MFKRFTRKKALGLVAAAIVTSIVAQNIIFPNGTAKSVVNAAEATLPSKIDSASVVNYATILGGAVDYGIVANELNQTLHSETTFAVNYFEQGTTNNDVDYLNSTANFIIGKGLGPANATDRSSYRVRLGHTRATSIYFEAPAEVFGAGFSSNPTLSGTNRGNFIFDSTFYDPTWTASETVFMQSINDNASTNVDRLINRIAGATGRSNDINAKAAPTSEFVLNPDGDNCYWFGGPSGPNTAPDYNNYYGIYLNDTAFANKVVYINVTDNMLQAIRNSGLRIHKFPSTVVVFNFPQDDDIQIKEPKLTIYEEGDPSTKIITDMNASTATNGGDFGTVKAENVEKYYNQSIIWNFMTTKTVNIYDVGGVMLCPKASEVLLEEQSSGWIIANNKVTTKAELHFLYNSGSTDTKGQMHFALTKGFTNQYGVKNAVEPNATVLINEGDYSFEMQEVTLSNSTQWDNTNPYFWLGNGNGRQSYNYGTAQNVDVRSDGSVIFPKLTFYCDNYWGLTDAQRHYFVSRPYAQGQTNSNTFYFIIHENDSPTVPGIHNSVGRIYIQLRVTVDYYGNFKYAVKYLAQTGDDLLNQTIYNDETANWVDMSGVQYDLGTFYNRIDETGLAIDKKVEGDCTAAFSADYKFTVTSTEGNTTYYYDEHGNKSTTYTEVTLTTAASSDNSYGTGRLVITGLQAGVELTVTEVGADRAGYDLKTTGSGTRVVTIDRGQPFVKINNTYTTNSSEPVDISKVRIAGTGYEEVSGATLTLTGTLADGTTPASFTQSQLTGGGTFVSDGSSLVFESGSTASTISGLEDGTYLLKETGLPTSTEGTYDYATDIEFTISGGKITGTNITANSDNTYTEATGNNNALFRMVDDFTPITTTVDISKFTLGGNEVAGAVLTLTGPTGTTFAASQVSGGATDVSASGNVLTFTSGTTSSSISGLANGTYTLHEKTKPADTATGSYSVATDITFTITNGAVTSVTGATSGVVNATTDENVYNTPTGGNTLIAMFDDFTQNSATPTVSVDISKITVGGSEVEGAVLTLTGPTGTTFAASQVTGGATSVSASGNVLTFTSGDSKSTISGLEPGTYTLHEKTVPTATATGTYSAATDIVFTIANDGTVTVDSGAVTGVVDSNTNESVYNTPSSGNTLIAMFDAFTQNTATPTCSIVLFKEAKLDGTNISARTFTFHVKGADNLYYGANGTTSSSPIDISVTSNDSNGVLLAGLPVQKYTVTEVEDYMPANCGYDPNSVRSCEVNNLTAGESRDVTLKNLYKTSTLTNYGSLTIEKTQDTGSETIPATDSFTFTVVFDAPITNAVADPNFIPGTVSQSTQTWSVDLKVGQKAVLNNLPVGIGYTITETAVTGYRAVPAITGTITASGNIETIANYLQPTTTPVPTGALKITKTVVTAQGSDAAPAGATFNVRVEFTVPAGTTLTGSYAVSGGNATVLSSTDTTVNVPLTAGQYVEFTGIPATVNYTVTETNIPEHFTASYSGATGTIAEGTTAEATVTNTYDYNAPVGPSGSLTLNKVVSGCPALNNTVVDFYVHNTTTDKYYDVNGAEYDTAVAVPVTPGTAVVINNLPDGTYEVTEDAPALPSGFVVDNDQTHTSGSDSITNGSAASVTLTNAYKVKPTPTGALVIEKSISGTDLNSLETITFTINGDNGTVLTAPELKFANVGTADGQWKSVGNGKYTYTFTGLVTGEKFTVTEILDGHTSTYVLVASSSKTTAISDAIRENDTVTVQLTDAYQKVTTSPNPTPTDIKHPITFTKDDITTLENLPGTSIIIKDENGNTVGTWTHGDTPETIELPAGTYTLVESSTPTGYKPIKPDTTITVGSNGTITSATGSARVDGNNLNFVIVDYEPVTPANVTISKQDVAGNEIPQATLTITSIDGFDLSGCVVTQNGAAVKAVLSNGNKSISFVTISTWPSIIRGLMPGTYELKETVTPEAYLTAEAIIFTVRDDGSVWVGTVEMQGSKIVMVDKADPTYNQKTNTNTNTAVTATGEGTSAYTVAALIMMMMASAFVATVFYRKWRYDVK